MNSVSDLPKIKEVLAAQMVEPTVINEERQPTEPSESLAVNTSGHLVPASGDAEENDDGSAS